MPSSTEVALLRLKKAWTTEELAKDETHTACLATNTSQPGNLGCTWGVLEEDPTMLVWLVEWETMAHHTEGFAKSDLYKPFSERMFTLLAADPIVYMSHFELDTSPSKIASCNHPTLEVLQVSLKPGFSASAWDGALNSVKARWNTEPKHKYAVAGAQDEGFQDRALLLVAWKDAAEHWACKKDPGYVQDFVGCKQMWQNVQIFGHMAPKFAPPRPPKST